MPLELDIDVLGRGFQSSNNTSANGMYFKTGYQPDDPQYSNSTIMYISNNRRIGVKTIVPLADFHVAGTILCRSLIQSDLAGGDTHDPGGLGAPFDINIVDNEIFVRGQARREVSPKSPSRAPTPGSRHRPWAERQR